jgi:carboxymethylenebutenolidase
MRSSNGASRSALVVLAIVSLIFAAPAFSGADGRWGSQDRPPSTHQIKPVKGEFFADGVAIDEFHCVPTSTGKHPVALLLHGCAPEGFGAGDFQRMCVSLAEHGYYAMFVEYYRPTGKPNCRDLAMDFADSSGPTIEIPDDTWVREVIDAKNSLAGNPAADTSRFGVVGFSFGGTLAVISAALNRHTIDAIVDYYGFSNSRVEGAVTKLPNFPPTLILQGDADSRAHVIDSIRLHDAIAQRQKIDEIRGYPQVEHGFNFRESAGYNHDASEDAWARTLSFLDRNLKGMR